MPDFSGWFGRDVALHGDLMAVVEAGHDVSGRNRGSSARVHVLQQSDGLWVSRRVLPVPFAHSVAFQDDLLVIGSYNGASFTKPVILPYRISRSDANEISLATMPQLVPASMATNATSHTFTFARPLPDPRLTVVVESSGDMSSWTEESGTPEILASGTTHEIVALTTAAATTRWWRVKARYREG